MGQPAKPLSFIANSRLSQLMRPWLLMWKLRLPLIVLPVLAGFRRLSDQGLAVSRGEEAWQSPMAKATEVTLLFVVAMITGYLQMPFSVTWWLVLILAFALETKLLLGVAAVLSLSVLLGWYGSLFHYPNAICALWGGTKGFKNSEGTDVLKNVPLRFWQVYDLIAHGIPAVLVLWWHGPGISMKGIPYAGSANLGSVFTALPLTLLWLWAVGLSLGKVWGVRLEDTNAAYNLEPALPRHAWRWIHGSHVVSCMIWAACLILPEGYAAWAWFPLVLYMFKLFAHSNLRKDLMLDRCMFFLAAHILAVMGAYRATMHPSAIRLWSEAWIFYQISGFGITCGAHRLWSHRSYVAKMPFRVFLMILNSFANQGTIFHWARDHRVHHRYTDTAADPHDASRGFFFAHIGWLLIPKHPDVKAKGNTVPIDDLLADPVVVFQKRAEELFMWMELVCFVVPGFYGMWVYNDFWLGFLVHGMLRWCFLLHATWCVNSVAHFFGDNKYDRNASPRESLATSILAVGEGWHSYHHKYPWDYATSELGASEKWNPSKILIDFGAAIGQCKSLKRADNFARRDLAKAQ